MTSMRNEPPPNTPALSSFSNGLKEPRPEEIKAYKHCLSNMYLEGGVPFAVLMEAARYFLQPAKKRTLAQKGLGFLGNIVLGTFLFSPLCYYRLLQMHEKFEKEELKKESGDIYPVTEDTSPVTAVHDFSYPTDVMTNLSEPETNFSSDFSSSNIIYEDEKDLKTFVTTYDDLRAHNRKTFASEPPVSTSNSGFSPVPNSTSQSASRPSVQSSPARKVVKNKYGDEIE